MINHLSDYWLIYVSAATAVPFAVFYFMQRGRSVSGGSRIRETIGQANGADSLGFGTLVRVHTLDSGDPSRAVALEIVTSVAFDLRTTPVTGSRQEAIALAALLNEAARRLSN